MKIEKGIPVPPRTRIPFDELQVGESVALDVPAGETPLSFSKKIRCSAWRAKKGDRDFKVRMDKSVNPTRIRVWRTQ